MSNSKLEKRFFSFDVKKLEIAKYSRALYQTTSRLFNRLMQVAWHRTVLYDLTKIFEIAASGAIAICKDHPFIRENFGDSVLYPDAGDETAAIVKRISEYMQRIGGN